MLSTRAAAGEPILHRSSSHWPPLPCPDDACFGLRRAQIAHQWFGDLVTLDDWTELWLNEGFATYFENIGEWAAGCNEAAMKLQRRRTFRV